MAGLTFTGVARGVGFTVTVNITAGPSLHETPLEGTRVYVTASGESVELTRLSVIKDPFGSPLAAGVNPVRPDGADAVKLIVTDPDVNVLGL